MEHGKNYLVLLQVTDNSLGEDAQIIGNLTESSFSSENDLTDEQTKFGRVLAYNGFNTESLEVTCYCRKGDLGQLALRRAHKERKQVKGWVFDKQLNQNGNHDAMFFYGLVESVEEDQPGDGFVEISGTIQVLGEHRDGELPEMPSSVLELGAYGFERPGDSTGDWGTEEHTYAPDSTITAPTITKTAATATTVTLGLSGGKADDIYTIFKNDKKIGTTQSTTYKLTGLTKATAYKFTALITRNGKQSQKSAELSVTTENN